MPHFEYTAGRCGDDGFMITESAEQTRELGRNLADVLRSGDTVLLRGELGAGKSELVRGIAEGLGISETVTSPSFTILNQYESGRIPLYHFDWYRLESSEELYELGLEEYLGGDGIAAVEWPERCEDAIPDKYLEIRMENRGGEIRWIDLQGRGGFQLPEKPAALHTDEGGHRTAI